MMNCIICKKSTYFKINDKVRDSKDYTIVQCINCKLTQLAPIPSDKENRDFYDRGRQLKNINQPKEVKILAIKQNEDTLRRASFLTAILKHGDSILDIGSGFGFLVEEMKNRGFKPTGIEISSFARRIAKKVTQVPIINIDMQKNKLNKKYNAITMYHVLEHLTDPINFIKKIKLNLYAKGKIIIEVPNIDDLMLTSNKAYNQFYWQRAHLLYLNKNTLTKILEGAGFSRLKFWYTQRYGLSNFMNWMMNNAPQIDKPVFETNDNYKWLERQYKKELIRTGKSDTLTVVISN